MGPSSYPAGDFAAADLFERVDDATAAKHAPAICAGDTPAKVDHLSGARLSFSVSCAPPVKAKRMKQTAGSADRSCVLVASL